MNYFAIYMAEQNCSAKRKKLIVCLPCIYKFQFDKLESCQNVTLAINLKIDHQKRTSRGKASQTSIFVAVEYYWEDESLDGAAKTERARSSFEFYAPSK